MVARELPLRQADHYPSEVRKPIGMVGALKHLHTLLVRKLAGHLHILAAEGHSALFVVVVVVPRDNKAAEKAVHNTTLADKLENRMQRHQHVTVHGRLCEGARAHTAGQKNFAGIHRVVVAADPRDRCNRGKDHRHIHVLALGSHSHRDLNCCDAIRSCELGHDHDLLQRNQNHVHVHVRARAHVCLH